MAQKVTVVLDDDLTGGPAEQTHVLFNNCYRDNAQAGAQQLAALLQP